MWLTGHPERKLKEDIRAGRQEAAVLTVPIHTPVADECERMRAFKEMTDTFNNAIIVLTVKGTVTQK